MNVGTEEFNETQLRWFEHILGNMQYRLQEIDRRQLIALITDYRKRGDRIRELVGKVSMLQHEVEDYRGEDLCPECLNTVDQCDCLPDDTVAQLRHEQYDDMRGARL